MPLLPPLLERPDVATSLEQAIRQAKRMADPVSADGPLRNEMGRSLHRVLSREVLPGRYITRNWRELPAVLATHSERIVAPAEQRTAGRRLHVRARQWLATVTEMLERLERDWETLVECLHLAPTCRLVAISPPLGDTHQDGRAVYGLRFTDGRRLIYKPRSVDQEHTLSRLIAWLHQNGCPIHLRACAVLPRGRYGWAEFVPSTFSATAEEALLFYRRQGAYLVIFWLLCADDLIGENVVVSGDHPVWVDTECMGVPEIANAVPVNASVPEWIRDSTLTTAMVYYGRRKGGSPRQSTGLNFASTADRTLVFTPDNILRRPYRDAVVNGFKEVYRWMLAAPEFRSADSGPVSWWQNLHVRVILRATSLYDGICELLACTPDECRENLEADIATALRADLLAGPKSEPWPETMIQLELDALRRGDIPYWHTRTNSFELCEGNRALRRE
jgi:hypothetical protein